MVRTAALDPPYSLVSQKLPFTPFLVTSGLRDNRAHIELLKKARIIIIKN